MEIDELSRLRFCIEGKKKIVLLLASYNLRQHYINSSWLDKSRSFNKCFSYFIQKKICFSSKISFIAKLLVLTELNVRILES